MKVDPVLRATDSRQVNLSSTTASLQIYNVHAYEVMIA